MMKAWWILILLVRSANAQLLYDSYSMATSSADVCSARGTYLGRNPASIAQQKSTQIGLEQILPYSISSLRANLFYFSSKYKNQYYALEYQQQGIDGYREYLSGLSVGMNVHENMLLGIKIVGAALNIQEESIQMRYRVELGIVQHLHKKLEAGLHIRLRTNKTIEVWQNTALSMGLRYLLDSKLPLHVSVEMSELGPTRVRAAMEYMLGKALAVRLGWNNKDAALSGGIGYNLGKYSLNMSTSYHNRLGLSYGLGMGLRLQEK